MYDWIVGVLGLGTGNWYRRQALKRAGLRPGMSHLDLATGTGVVANAAMEITGGDLRLTGADVSLGMLDQARRNFGITPVQAMGESLPFADGSFDFISIGFALRHFAELRGLFRELRRVLRPGGRLLILEITPPRSRIGRSILSFYMDRLVPLAARIRSRDRRLAVLMHYYWDTTRTCVPPETILRSLEGAGFSEPRRHVEAFVFSEYTGSRSR